MYACKLGLTVRFIRVVPTAIAATVLSLAILGCSDSFSNHDLRNDLATIHAMHGDGDGIGSLDETAPPTDLATYRQVSAQQQDR
jgi:hypothetical protein